MNIFFILTAISCVSLFSAFIFSDLDTIRTTLIVSLAVYLIGVVFEVKSGRKSARRVVLQKSHNI